MNNQEVLNSIKCMVVNYCNHHYESQITVDDVYIVWFCKILQNWKALASTDAIEGKYFEITYNGDTKEIYVDVYTQQNNMVIGENVWLNYSFLNP